MTWSAGFRFVFALTIFAGACSKEPAPGQSQTLSLEQRHRAELEEQARIFRARVSAAPNEQKHALVLARTLIELARVTSEPAHKLEAEQAIARWAEGPNPSPEALILRATIRQSRHDFDGALFDLQAALKLSPSNAQGWLTLSVILVVRGEYDAALKACAPLATISNPLAVAACQASVLGVSGQSNAARERLEKALGAGPQISPAERVWALVILAEVCARIGDAPSADSAYQRAFAAGIRDEYLLASYADFLLDQEKYPQVVALLEKEANVEPLLLRLAIAERALQKETGVKHAAMVRAVFQQNRARGDLTHAREEARLYLAFQEIDPHQVVSIARANFAVQREPWDVRVLLMAALHAKDKAAAAPALEFIDKTKLEDVYIHRLAEQVRALPGGS